MKDEAKLSESPALTIDSLENALRLSTGTFTNLIEVHRKPLPQLAHGRILAAGSSVQLHFNIVERSSGKRLPQGERMWVKAIRPNNGGGGFWGELAEQSSFDRLLAPGRPIWFDSKHVIEIRDGATADRAAMSATAPPRDNDMGIRSVYLASTP